MNSPAPPSRSGRRLLARTVEVLAVLALTSLVVLYAMAQASSTGFLVEVSDHQVALLVDNRTGEVRTDDTPGYHALVPWLQDAYRLDKSPVEYRMEGDQWKSFNHVPRLTVRASDGSQFWFDTVQIQYAIRPEEAWTVTRDAGAEYGWHHGPMDAVARSVLRDEFGRHTAEQIVRAEVLRDATLRAKLRLSEAVAARGLVVHEILTSKPAFPPDYESVVQRRKVAEREIELFVQEIEQLRASRDTRLAKLERGKELEESNLLAQLERDLRKAERETLRTRREADRAHEAKITSGEQKRDELLSQADSARERFEMEAEGFRARAAAMAAQGELAVRKKLIENLSSLELEIEPFEPFEERARRTGGL